MHDPVLADRADVIGILNVTAKTFDRLCREGRFDDAAIIGKRQALYRLRQLRDHISSRSTAMRRRASRESVTIAISPPNEIIDFRRTESAEIAADARKATGIGNDTGKINCAACGAIFRPLRAGHRTCSAKCQKRAARAEGRYTPGG